MSLALLIEGNKDRFRYSSHLDDKRRLDSPENLFDSNKPPIPDYSNNDLKPVSDKEVSSLFTHFTF